MYPSKLSLVNTTPLHIYMCMCLGVSVSMYRYQLQFLYYYLCVYFSLFSFISLSIVLFYPGENPHSVVTNMLNCDIVVSNFDFLSYVIMFTFRLKPLGKVRIHNPPSCVLNSAALILDNPRSLISH